MIVHTIRVIIHWLLGTGTNIILNISQHYWQAVNTMDEPKNLVAQHKWNEYILQNGAKHELAKKLFSFCDLMSFSSCSVL